MLIDKIFEAKALVDQVKSDQIKVSQHDKYAGFLTELKASLPSLNRYQQTCELLQTELADSFAKVDLQSEINKINGMLTALKGDTPPNKFLVKQLVDQVQKWEDQLKQAWQHYVDDSSGHSRGALDSIKGILDDTSKIDDLFSKLNKIKNQWPVSKQTIEDLTTTIYDAMQIIKKLNADAEVQKFLELVSARKARLSDLKPEILQWLQQNKLTKNLEISFAKSQRGI